MNPLLIKALAVIGVLTIGFSTGFLVQGWRLDSKHERQMAECNAKYHALELSVVIQNGGIELANYKLEVAEESRKVAEANAVFAKSQYVAQAKKANEIVATTCSAMVEQLKGVK